MEDALVDWDDPSDPDGNTAHLAEHDLSPEEIESVLRDPNASHDVRFVRSAGGVWNHQHWTVYCCGLRGASSGRSAHRSPHYRLRGPGRHDLGRRRGATAQLRSWRQTGAREPGPDFGASRRALGCRSRGAPPIRVRPSIQANHLDLVPASEGTEKEPDTGAR